MSDYSPYMIRLELLKLAQGILDNQNMATQDRLRMDWDAAEEKYEFPDMPTATTEQVIEQAKLLNEFVSQKG